jgi:hypothetical protein
MSSDKEAGEGVDGWLRGRVYPTTTIEPYKFLRRSAQRELRLLLFVVLFLFT